MICTAAIEELIAQLSGFAYRFGCELDLQDDLEFALAVLGVPFLREHSFDQADRIDFFLPETGLGIECKTDGSPAMVAGQLIRYAEQDAVRGLLLVSRRRAHGDLPNTLRGKPTGFLWVGGGRL